jgi:hypothetical protein
MYCSTCGSAVAQSLSYCNRCGAKVGGAKGEDIDKPAEMSLDSLVWAMVAVFIAGLGVIIGLMAVMKEVVRFEPGIILAISLLSFILLLVIEGVLIRLLLSNRRGAQETGHIEPSKEQTTKELEWSQARALPEPVPSVIEDATRKFEPVYSERKSK